MIARRSLYFMAVAGLVLLVTALPASAQSMLALVIGNATYAGGGIFTRLPKSTNDADDVAAALRTAGFQTTVLKNAKKDDIGQSVIRFVQQLQALGADGVGFVYFSGHGARVGDEGYLIPSDKVIGSSEDLVEHGYPINLLVTRLRATQNRINIVVIDACRNDVQSLTMGAAGLPPLQGVPRGTVVAYSTGEGSYSFADHPNGRNSVYTGELLRAFLPGSTLEQIFERTNAEVAALMAARRRGTLQSPKVFAPESAALAFTWPGVPSARGGRTEPSRPGQPTAHIEAPPMRLKSSGERLEIDVLAGARHSIGRPLSVTAVTAPGIGTLDLFSNGKGSYAPKPGAQGEDRFRVTVADDQGLTGRGKRAVPGWPSVILSGC